MKSKLLITAALFCNLMGTAQITQDSINKLQEDINKSQASINKRQREVNALQKSVDVDFRSNDESGDLIRNILNDLLAMKIITNKDVVAFTLSMDHMEVNSKKQSDAVLETFKFKYHIVKGYSIEYAKAKNSTSTSITK
jgi:uncharacterized protein YlxW (UPF0749 family)